MLLRPRPFLRPAVFRHVVLRRLLIGGGLIAIFVAGAAVTREVRGTSATPTTIATIAATNAVADALAESEKAANGRQARLGFRPRLGRHVLHAVVTVERDGQLLTFQIDRGKIESIGGGKLTISEAGGSSVTVTTDEATRVRRDRKRIELTALKAGDDVYVISRVPSAGGEAVAIRIAAPTVKRPGG